MLGLLLLWERRTLRHLTKMVGVCYNSSEKEGEKREHGRFLPGDGEKEKKMSNILGKKKKLTAA